MGRKKQTVLKRLEKVLEESSIESYKLIELEGKLHLNIVIKIESKPKLSNNQKDNIITDAVKIWDENGESHIYKNMYGVYHFFRNKGIRMSSPLVQAALSYGIPLNENPKWFIKDVKVKYKEIERYKIK